jgi:hypothetical protein
MHEVTRGALLDGKEIQEICITGKQRLLETRQSARQALNKVKNKKEPESCEGMPP